MFKATHRMQLIMLILLALAALMLLAFQAEFPPQTLCEALAWIGTAAAVNVLLGAFIAAMLEYWSAWGGFPPKSKRPIVLAFCLVVPLLSLVARYFLCAAVIDQDTIYLAILAGLTGFTGSQFAHIKKLPSG